MAEYIKAEPELNQEEEGEIVDYFAAQKDQSLQQSFEVFR